MHCRLWGARRGVSSSEAILWTFVGLPLAVTCLNRCSFFLQPVIRRILRALGSFYFDDLTVQDWQTTASACQRSVQCVCALVGYPFADKKQQQPASQSNFLGLVHDLAGLRADSTVRLWIRDRLIEKVRSPASTARRAQCLSPGQASVSCTCLTFLDQGAFGRRARAGLNAFKHRQYAIEFH